MWYCGISAAIFALSLCCHGIIGHASVQAPLLEQSFNRTLSTETFANLEELARVVDIAYCVGTTGIQKPFLCASRCQDFKDFELITTWNTGLLLADSCGYIAVSHPPSAARIIVAFRGTYSIANTIVDLSTIPQEYAPYLDDGDNEGSYTLKCTDCSVHTGFMTSWLQTRSYIVPHLQELLERYPGYELTLVGHSLGGALAVLASLDFMRRGWRPQVTTFGEPRIGNQGLVRYIDEVFSERNWPKSGALRRVTHMGDPVPLLPFLPLGYKMHAGEIYISKPDLPPSALDMHNCAGDEDPECIAGTDSAALARAFNNAEKKLEKGKLMKWWVPSENLDIIPGGFQLWQLLFAHRDYFWRLGLCISGGDPKDWYRKYQYYSEL